MKRHLAATLFLANCVLVIGCVVEPTNRANRNASNANVSALPTATPTMSPTPSEKAAKAQTLTLPVLDAFLADESFSSLLKTRLQLTDEQIVKLNIDSKRLGLCADLSVLLNLCAHFVFSLN